MKLVMALDQVLVEVFTEKELFGLNLADKKEYVCKVRGGKP